MYIKSKYRKIISMVIAVALMAIAFIIPQVGFVSSAYTQEKSDGTANIKMIDLSHNNEVSDWSKLATQVKAAYFKATQGTTFVDPKMATFTMNAEKVGIKYGYYHYFIPNVSTTDAANQAIFFYNTIKNFKYSLKPALDVEEVVDSNGKPITKAEVTADVTAFCNKFKSLSGQDMIIYSSPAYTDEYFSSSISTKQYWDASYTSYPYSSDIFSSFIAWQYNYVTNLLGTVGKVDVDWSTNQIYLTTKQNPTNPVILWDSDVYQTCSMGIPTNAYVDTKTLIYNKKGVNIGEHYLNSGESISIVNVCNDYFEIYYKLNTGGYVHGYILINGLRTVKLSSNNNWINGKTPETAYNLSKTQKIGTLGADVKADYMYKLPCGDYVIGRIANSDHQYHIYRVAYHGSLTY